MNWETFRIRIRSREQQKNGVVVRDNEICGSRRTAWSCVTTNPCVTMKSENVGLTMTSVVSCVRDTRCPWAKLQLVFPKTAVIVVVLAQGPS